MKIWTTVFVLFVLGALTVYFLSSPDSRKTETYANRFAAAAGPGAHLADAVRASPDFKSITFGGCGRLNASPDSGPEGSFIYVPTQGAFARYTSFDEFLRLNPKILAEHEECRNVSVLFEAIFPYRGQVDLLVNERGIVVKRGEPVFFN